MARVEIDIVANDRTGGVLSKIGSSLQSIFQTAMGFLSAHVFMRIAQEVSEFATTSIKAASDFNETFNKTNEIFEDSADLIHKWATTAAQSTGLSKTAAENAASGFAIFGKAAGLASNDLAEFAMENTQLAADMASFFNTTVEDAAYAIQAMFRGETEPIRRYGVLIDEATLKTKALELGIISSTKDALSPQNKVLAANALLWEQTGDAQGDFARTSEGYANQQRIFNAQLENAKIQLGDMFLPALTEVMQYINTVGIPALENLISSLQPVIDGFIAFMRSIGDTQAPQYFMDFLNFLSAWWTANGTPIKQSAEEMFMGLADMARGAGTEVNSFVDEVLGKLTYWLAENAPLIQQFAQVVSDAFTNIIVPAISAFWNLVRPLLMSFIDYILNMATLIMQVATGDFAGAWETMKTIVISSMTTIREFIKNAVNMILQFFGTSWAQAAQVWQQNWEQLKNIVNSVMGIIENTIRSKIASAISIIQTLSTAIKTVGSALSGMAMGAAGGAIRGGRAEGGFVGANRPYIVGERGPELFVPSGNGNIVPNNALGGGGVNITLVYSPAVSTASMSEVEGILTPIINNAVRQGYRGGQLG